MHDFDAGYIFLVADALCALACLVASVHAFVINKNNSRLYAALLASSALISGFYLTFLQAYNALASNIVFSLAHGIAGASTLLVLALAYRAVGQGRLFLKTPYSIVCTLVIASLSLVYMANPLTGIAGDVTALSNVCPFKWSFSFAPFHYVYTAAIFLVLVGAAVVIARKASNTSIAYRSRYLPFITAIVLVPVSNVIALYCLNLYVDYSVVAFCVLALFVYLCSRLGYGTFFERSFQVMLLDEVGQSILLFDDGDQLVLHNQSARALVERYVGKDESLGSFMKATGFTRTVPNESRMNKRSFRWVTTLEGQERSYRVDYRPLSDSQERFIGTLFIFIDDYLETDVITGLSSKLMLLRWLKANENGLPKPTSFVAFDINGLTRINQKLGREHGDRALRMLSDEMRQVFPQKARFARMDEAMLLAFVPGEGSNAAHELAREVVRNMRSCDVGAGPLSVSYTVSVARDACTTPRAAIAEATRALNVNKLLSPESSHTSLLDSLVQALVESGVTSQQTINRVSSLSLRLAKTLGISDYDRTLLILLCRVHDLGMLTVPLTIQNKPSSLTDEEFGLIRRHAYKGYRIALASEELHDVAPLVLHHHERWDGYGYPDGLKGEAIPLLDRILFVADVYDSLTHDRPYRKAVTPAQALIEIGESAGEQFDPYVVSRFVQMMKDSDVLEQNGDDGAAAEDNVEFTRSFGARPLAVSLQSTESALASVPHSHYQIDARGFICNADDAFESMTGYSSEDLKELKLTQGELIFLDDRDKYFALASESFEKSNTIILEHRLRRKDGEETLVLCVGINSIDPFTGLLASQDVIIADIANTHLMTRQLEELRMRARQNSDYWENKARVDALTGALSRNSFKGDVRQLLARDGYDIAFGILDVDKFKTYNDTYGHPEGDELLKRVVVLLKESVPADSVIGRLGGDEFAIAVSIEHDGCISDDEITERFKDAHATALRSLADTCRGASCSFGVVVVHDTASVDFDELYRLADAALYHVKENGRGAVNVTFA